MVELSIPIAGYLLLAIVILATTVHRREVDFLSIFNGFYLIAFSLAPLHILLGGVQFVHHNERVILEEYTIGTLTALGAVWLSWILICGSYLWVRKRVKAGTNQRKQHIGSRAGLVVTISAIFITAVAIIMYSSEYGGVMRAISLASEIRNGDIEEGGPFVFFKPLLSFAFVALVFAFGLLVRSSTRSPLSYGLFAISLVLGAVVVALTAGRIGILVAVATCYLVAAVYHQRPYIVPITVIGIIGFVFILFSNILFAFSSLGIDGILDYVTGLDLFEIYALVWTQFSHMYLSLEVAIAHPEHSTRHITDWVVGFAHLLPQTLLGISLPGTVSHINTEIITGEYVSRIIPGLVAFLWYSGGWLGICIGGSIYGAVGAVIDRWINMFQKTPEQLTLYYSIALIWGFQFVRAGDPRILFRGQIDWIIVLFAFALATMYAYNQSYPTRMRDNLLNKND